MKKWTYQLVACALLASVPAFAADAPATSKTEIPANPRIGVINFKLCVEESKIGKQEQASFEAMKKQMESVVEEKENVLNELANKLNNPDELDLMSPEAETDLKRKFRALSQEMSQIQNQFYQTLNQANFKIVQKLSDLVTEASQVVAKDLKLDLVINDEMSFYSSNTLDISSNIIKELDLQHSKAPATPAQQKAPATP